MKAYQLIARATLDSPHLTFVRDMFEDAWNSIAPKYRTPLESSAARLALTSAILLAANNGLDPEDIKRVAVALVAPDLER